MFADLLASRPGAAPLFIHYDEAVGSRVELSAATFRNWVDKTANLLEDLGIEPAESVQLELALTAPGHWTTAVWVAAIWQRGCTVSTSAEGTEVAVVGPDSSTRGPITVMCSLHPLGLGLTDLPADCVDYAEVLAQPDVHWAEEPAEVAWAPAISPAEVAAVTPQRQRRLIADPAPGWAGISQILVAPVLGGGSSVVVTGASPDRLAVIADQERAITTP